MFVVRGTKKFRDRVKPPLPAAGGEPTTVLGDWYATVLFWKPQVALFVSERTLIPVFVPFAPAATLIARFPEQLRAVLAAHDVPAAFVDEEISKMGDYALQPTANRRVVGMLNEFTFLAETHVEHDPAETLLELSVNLAHTPCGPLYKSHSFPYLELAALVVRQLESGG